MSLEMHCPHCQEAFTLPEASRAAHVLGQMLESGPWWSIGDGETLEDQVSTALGTADSVDCPFCGHLVELDEAGVGQFALELLGQW